MEQLLGTDDNGHGREKGEVVSQGGVHASSVKELFEKSDSKRRYNAMELHGTLKLVFSWGGRWSYVANYFGE